MPESLLAAQREAIAEAVYAAVCLPGAQSARHYQYGREKWLEAADAVLGLVDAWLVDAVQAERERILAAVEALPRIIAWGALGADYKSTNNALERDAVLAVVSRDTRNSSDV